MSPDCATNNRLLFITLFGSTNRRRPKGLPPKRWFDCYKENCLNRGIASLTLPDHGSSRTGTSGEPSAVGNRA